MAHPQQKNELQNTVVIDDKDRIVLTLNGKQTGATIREITRLQGTAAAKLTAQHKRIHILVDLSNQGFGDSSSEARRAAKNSFTGSYDKIAVFGNSKIMSLVSYLYRFGGQRGKMQFFSNRRTAERWLDSSGTNPSEYREMVSLVSGLLIGVIGILTLIGWHTDNDYLIRWLTSLRPMNPMAAVGLVAIGFGFCCYWLKKLTPLKVVGVFGIILGLAALSPLHLDHLLYASKLSMMGAHTDLADSAALCFIAVGLTPFTVGTNNRFVRMLQYAAGITIMSLSLFNVFGQLYAHNFIYGLSDNFVMGFGLAIAFLAVGITLVLLVLYRQSGNVLGRVTRTGWLILFALIGVQALAYGVWYQAQSKNNTDSSGAFAEHSAVIDQAIEQRVRSYVDALYGFKGLYAASDSVTQGEFQTYYNSLNLTETYPGLRALSFISAVNDKDLPTFVDKQRKDTSLHPGGNPTFKITGQTTAPTHYIFTYNASNPDTVGGNDFSGVAIRKNAYEKAAATNKPVASGTLEFPGTNGQAPQKGFFITMPVSNKKSGQVIGFVSAVFNYKDFFTKTFVNDQDLLSDLKVSIIDTEDNTVAFAHPDKEKAWQEYYYYADTVPVADRVWGLKINAIHNFGLTKSQADLPWIVLVGSQLFSGLLVVIFVIQARGRRQALELAERITEDLQQERNMAVGNDQKSSAILASIGDAVFAVDRHERITLFNPAAAHISGYDESEALGRRYDDILKFVFENDHHKNSLFVRRAFDGHVTSMKNHTVLIRKDGREVSVADSAAPIRDAKGKIQGVIVVFRDVSKEKLLEKAKTEFVSLASHQLRTPLSAINWYSEMLLNGDAGKMNKDQHEYLKEIFEGNQRMIELVDSLLNVSRLEVGKLKNEPQPTSLVELADSLEHEMETSTRAKQIVIKNEIEKKLPIVSADPKLLRMVVQNLLSNAVKYTPEKGGVTLTMRVATDKDIAGKLRPGRYVFISVADTGYGIPESQQDKIFQKLFRADNVRKLDVEGTGLGLYIVKEVAEKLGGTIWFESMESVGTTFYVIIPVKTNPS